MQGNQLLIKKSDNTVTAGISGSTSGAKIRFWAGSTSPTTSSPWYVDEYGKMVAKNAVITGEINTNSGTIGAFEIDRYGLVNEVSNPTAHIKLGNEMTEFVYINSSNDSGMLSVRTQDKVYAIRVQAYEESTGLYIIGNTDGYAIDSAGNHRFHQRESEKWSAPGVLWAGRVSTIGGSIEKSWGNGTGGTVTASPNATTGNVRITHALGRTD